MIKNLEINYKNSKLSKIDKGNFFKAEHLFLIFIIFYYIISINTFSNHQPSRLNESQIKIVDNFLKEIDEYNAYIRNNNLENYPVNRDRNWIPASPYAQCLLLNNKLPSN